MAYLLRKAGVIAFGIVALAPSVALAQIGEGLQIKPAIVEDNVSLGVLSQYSVTVTNVSSGERTFYISTKDIKGLDDEGLPVFAAEGEQTGFELSSWVSLPSSAITLRSGETKTITFSVHVPSRASPGAHFGAVFLTTKPPLPGQTGSAVSYSVGTIVNLKIAGEAFENAQLREFLTEKTVYSEGTVHFNSKIENSGNVLARPHGVIDVSDMFGRKVGSVEVNATGAPVFPGSSRRYKATWISDGFAFGRYQAIASFSYGETESKTITGTTSFWILPMKPIAIVLGVLLAIIVGMYIAIRIYIRRKLRDMGVSPDSRDANYYARKYERSGSRMIVTTLVVFVVCVVFLGVLFLLLA